MPPEGDVSPAVNSLTGGEPNANPNPNPTGDPSPSNPENPSGNANPPSGNQEGITNPDVAWLGQDASEEFINLARTKGWTGEEGPKKAVESYANLEKLLGQKANAIIKPAADAPQAEWDSYFAQLGRPETPDKYELKLPENADTDLAEAAKSWFHEAGLPNDQAQKLIDKQVEYMEQVQQQQVEEFMKRSNQEAAELQSELGDKFDDTMERARRSAQMVMQQAGWEQADFDQLEMAIGTKKMLQGFAAFGNMLTEAGAPETSSGAFQSTPEYAKSQIAKLQGDPDFQKRYLSPDPNIRNAAIDEFNKWFKQAHGENPVT